MKPLIAIWIGIFSLLQISNAATELLANPDMETVSNWKGKGKCTLTSSTDSYSGANSIMVTNRDKTSDGIAQKVEINASTHYNFTVYVKPVPDEGSTMFETAELRMSCKGGANGTKILVKFSRDRQIQNGKWKKIGGNEKVPSGAHTCQVYVQVFNSTLAYLVDKASLQVIPVNTNWRAEANARIENIRKANISVSLSGDTSGSYEVELMQMTHDFAFGSAVGAYQIVDPSYTKYQEVFYQNFEWAVLENKLKWQQMEKTQGVIDYNTPLTALRALQGNGTKVRGHAIFWATQQHVADWVQSLSQAELLQAIDNRTTGVVGATKGLVEHWDVNNEAIHGNWYETKLNDLNVTMDMFRDAQRVDPGVKLFLNDFGIMQNLYSVAYQNQANSLKDNGVPIYGVGIQSHIKDANLDMTTLKANLDTVAEAGLPIVITEMSVSEADENLKASACTDLLTLYFSHPSIEGVLFWGFWDGKIFDQNTSLFVGENVTPNAAGQAYQTLYKTTWTTSETRILDGNTPVNVRGFMGNYKIIVKQNGTIVNSEQFHLGPLGQLVQINVGESTEITFA